MFASSSTSSFSSSASSSSYYSPYISLCFFTTNFILIIVTQLRPRRSMWHETRYVFQKNHCSRCLEPESISYPYLGHAEAFQEASQLLGSAAVAWDRSWQNVALHRGHNRQANPGRHRGRLPGAVKKCLEPGGI